MEKIQFSVENPLVVCYDYHTVGALHYEITSLREGYRFVVLLLSPQYQLLYWYYIYPFVA